MRRKKARGALPGALHVTATAEGCNHWIFSSTITSRLHTLPLSQNTLFHWYLLPFPGRSIFNLPSIHYGIASSICWLIRTYIDHKRSCDLGTYSCNVELLAWTMICLAKWYTNSEPWENMCVKEKERGRERAISSLAPSSKAFGNDDGKSERTRTRWQKWHDTNLQQPTLEQDQQSSKSISFSRSNS